MVLQPAPCGATSRCIIISTITCAEGGDQGWSHSFSPGSANPNEIYKMQWKHCLYLLIVLNDPVV